jgi:hypothetical protein
MSEPTNDIKKRLLFILHRGWVEARELAALKKSEQLYDLADALHEIPACMSRWRAEDLDAIRLNLKTYCDKYPQSARRYQYLEFLDKWEPPSF